MGVLVKNLPAESCVQEPMIRLYRGVNLPRHRRKRAATHIGSRGALLREELDPLPAREKVSLSHACTKGLLFRV